jgi:hypothetical protein
MLCWPQDIGSSRWPTGPTWTIPIMSLHRLSRMLRSYRESGDALEACLVARKPNMVLVEYLLSHLFSLIVVPNSFFFLTWTMWYYTMILLPLWARSLLQLIRGKILTIISCYVLSKTNTGQNPTNPLAHIGNHNLTNTCVPRTLSMAFTTVSPPRIYTNTPKLWEPMLKIHSICGCST